MNRLSFLILFLILLLFQNVLWAQNPEAILEKAKQIGDSGKLAEAMSMIDKVMKVNTQIPKAYHYKGRIYMDLNKLDSAIIMFKKTLSLDPKYANSYFNLGICYNNQNNLEEALTMFRKYSSLKPENPDGWHEQAYIFNTQETLDSALFYYEKAIQLDKTIWKGYYGIASIYYKQKNYDKASQKLDDALKICVLKDNLFLLKGRIYEEQEKYEDALTSYTQALEANGQNLDAMTGKAALLYNFSQFEEAIQQSKTALGLDSLNFQAIYVLTTAYLAREEWNNAYKTALNGQKYYQDADIFYQLAGLAQYNDRNYSQAITQFDKAISLNPKEIRHYRSKSYALLEKNTPHTKLKDGAYLRFKEISSFNTTVLSNWVNDKANAYYYPTLLQKFKENHLTMGLDEYFMFYYGSTEQSDFSPYGEQMGRKITIKEMSEAFDKKDFKKAIQMGENYLKQYPLAFNIYIQMAIVYFEMENYPKYEEYIYKYWAFLKGITCTGDGKTAETAYIVASVQDEYTIFYHYGLEFSSQALMREQGHVFDVLKQQKSDKNEAVELYFNIDKVFGVGFMDKAKSKKKKKSKKKDK